MLCPKCKTENLLNSNFCSQCGAPLNGGINKTPGKFSRQIALILCLFVLFAGTVFYFSKDKAEDGNHSGEAPIQSDSFSEKIPVQVKPEHKSALPEPGRNKRLSLPMTVGRVIVKNRFDVIVSKIPVVVTSGRLVALPTKACIGGNQLIFSDGKRNIPISEGIWRSGDKIGLWYLDRNLDTSGTILYPWTKNEPVIFISFESGRPEKSFVPSSLEKQGLFLKGSFAQIKNRPGIIIQNNMIVGWSFGAWLDGYYLWIGPPEGALYPYTTVETFYGITFSGGREEQFERAFSMEKDVSPSVRLDAFSEGFRYDPKLKKEETPDRFRSELIIQYMRELVSGMMREGKHRQVAGILDNIVLFEANSVPLFLDAVMANSKGYGKKIAIDLLESAEDRIDITTNQERKKIDHKHLELCRGHVKELVQQEDYSDGMDELEDCRRFFPEDPYLNLLGVKLELLNGEWREAKRRLDMYEYPANLMNIAGALEMQISEIKAQEGKIVIPYPPGAAHIPVTAVINGDFDQKFIVDTGATFITIPSSTAESLGIDINDETPKRRVKTAGGIKTVYEITLSSIELKGYLLENLKAFIVDLPDDPALGLLGNNFLNQFHMEVNNEKGLLMLVPR